jgi:perosamine synthetase
MGDADERAVLEVLRSGRLVQGERVERFESLVAELTGRAHAVAVSSGTSALELALTVLDVGPGDDVLVPDLTWPSPAHAVRLRGARPVLVDVDAREWNATAESFAAARTEQTVAAIAIDQLGFPARHDAIAAALPGVALVEDAACALGARYLGRPCGGFGAIACASFHPRKVVVTGEGGMCLTDDAALAARLRRLRNHGQDAPGVFTEPAGNHRMTELAAAIGIVQLEDLAGRIHARARLAARYRAALPSLRFQEPVEDAEPSYQTMGAVLPDGLSRDTTRDELRARGVEAGLLSYALHRLPSLDGHAGGPFPEAERLANRAIALPLWAGLGERDQDRVIAALSLILPAEP